MQIANAFVGTSRKRKKPGRATKQHAQQNRHEMTKIQMIKLFIIVPVKSSPFFKVTFTG